MPLLDHETPSCPVCGQSVGDEAQTWCEQCRQTYPWPLLKATMNNWTFYARLITGEIVCFTEASITGSWVTLKGAGLINASDHSPLEHDDPLMYGRGLVVQVDHIVWCADEDS